MRNLLDCTSALFGRNVAGGLVIARYVWDRFQAALRPHKLPPTIPVAENKLILDCGALCRLVSSEMFGFLLWFASSFRELLRITYGNDAGPQDQTPLECV